MEPSITLPPPPQNSTIASPVRQLPTPVHSLPPPPVAQINKNVKPLPPPPLSLINQLKQLPSPPPECMHFDEHEDDDCMIVKVVVAKQYSTVMTRAHLKRAQRRADLALLRNATS